MSRKRIGHLHVLAEHGQALGIRCGGLLQLGELAPPRRGKLEQNPPEAAHGRLEFLSRIFEQRPFRVLGRQLAQLGPQHAQDPAEPDVGGMPALSLEPQRTFERTDLPVLSTRHDRTGVRLLKRRTQLGELTAEALVLERALADGFLEPVLQGCGVDALRPGVRPLLAQVRELAPSSLGLLMRLVSHAGGRLECFARLVSLVDRGRGVFLGEREAVPKAGSLLGQLDAPPVVAVAGTEAVWGWGLCKELTMVR